MKKYLTILMISSLALSLTACGTNNNQPQTSSNVMAESISTSASVNASSETTSESENVSESSSNVDEIELMKSKTKKEMTPYVQYLGYSTDSDGYPDADAFDSSDIEKMDSVYFMGRFGQITFSSDDGYFISGVLWTDNSTMNEDTYNDFVNTVQEYENGEDPTIYKPTDIDTTYMWNQIGGTILALWYDYDTNKPSVAVIIDSGDETEADSSNDSTESSNNDQTQSQSDSETSEIMDAYNTACSLTIDDLSTNSSGGYSYNDFDFLSDDTEWINDSGTIEKSAFYRKMATVLWNHGNIAVADVYIKTLMGYVPDNYDDFLTAADNAKSFITTDHAYTAFEDKLSTISSATVNNDGNTSTIEISDMKQCASDLGISDEMFGYTLAAMEDYAATVTFSGNGCTLTNSYSDR